MSESPTAAPPPRMFLIGLIIGLVIGLPAGAYLGGILGGGGGVKIAQPRAGVAAPTGPRDQPPPLPDDETPKPEQPAPAGPAGSPAATGATGPTGASSAGGVTPPSSAPK